MAGEGHHLLERRPICPPHRVGQQPGDEDDALLRRQRPPGRRIWALCGLELSGGVIERGPESIPARCEIPGTAVATREHPADRVAQERAQVLVDVPVPA